MQLRAYLEMLHLAAEAHEDGSRQVRDESEGDAEEEEGDCHQCAKAIVPPALAAWTEEETDKFFQALRRFSRFRPDAIAEHVRTKNEIEVSALLELLEEESALVDVDGTEARAKRAPAARKMSEAWIKLEERLAEDAIIWEAFVQRAERTPSQMRDKAQKSVTARLMPFSCVQCSVRSSTICDGRRPTCARCAEKGSRCSWEQGFHLEYSNAAPLQ